MNLICLLGHDLEYVYEPEPNHVRKVEWRPTGGGRWERAYALQECVECGKQVWQATAELRDILGDIG